MILLLASLALLCAAAPCLLFSLNLNDYCEPPRLSSRSAKAGDLEGGEESSQRVRTGAQSHSEQARSDAILPAVSILIPARNEAGGIAEAIGAALASLSVDFEIIVMDDQSTDSTAAIVADLARLDPRVRLEHSAPLPAGWNGKQHACWQLAQTARNSILCFVDADVRLEPDCIARMATFLAESKASLVSGFPRQLTESPLEWLLLPLIHFVLLGFLPITRMRSTSDPSFAAGCGQFLLADARDYFRCGGHREIRLTLHDGLRLPRLFRQQGLHTDLADLTHLASCRMYTSAAQVWQGLAKNATEGIAAPARIVPISLLLMLGQVAPFLFLPLALLTVTMAMFFGTRLSWAHPASALLLLAAAALAWLPRFLAAARFRQPWRSAILHPLGVTVLLAIQWYALARLLIGAPVTWRDRTYQPPVSAARRDGEALQK